MLAGSKMTCAGLKFSDTMIAVYGQVHEKSALSSVAADRLSCRERSEIEKYRSSGGRSAAMAYRLKIALTPADSCRKIALDAKFAAKAAARPAPSTRSLKRRTSSP